jgi:hypothetical protein
MTPTPLHPRHRNPQPISFEEARQAFHNLAEARRQALRDYEDRVREAAEAERVHNRLYAQELVQAKVDNPALVAEAIAKEKASEARMAMRIAEGMVKAADKKLDGIDGERSMLNKLVSWSMEVHPYGQEEAA